MIGIAALYKYGQSGVNPGDMLFLMRNLATNCTGLHRIAARCGFRKVSRIASQCSLVFSLIQLLRFLHHIVVAVHAVGRSARHTPLERR